MKKFAFLLTAAVLTLGSTLTVSAAGSVDKTATVTVQGGTLDLTVDNDIDFGFVALDGSTQTKANVGQDVLLSVSDALGDTAGWNVQLNIAPLEDAGFVSLAGQQYDFTAVGSDISGTGLTAGTNSTGVAPGTGINILSGDDSAVAGSITLKPGFLTLTVGSGAQAGTYSGAATFSVVTNP